MIFSTYSFVLGFLPLVFLGYFIFQHYECYNVARIWLVLASLYFYAQGSPAFFPFFLGSVFGNYCIGNAIGKLPKKDTRQRKLLLIVGVLGNVGLLGYYKYTNFFIENVNTLTGMEIPLKNIALPIGISFFTFQLIAFLVDSYINEGELSYDVIDYLLFITFFPQLIVGPIVHHAEVVPQFQDEKNQKINVRNIAIGLFIFAIGCAKKNFLADNMITDAQAFYNNIHINVSFLDSWFYSIEYAVAYYFDLSGYADMAIGLGYLFNIKIPENFNSPYKAVDFQDYWRRWHMTLSRFLGSYIFRSVYQKGNKWRNFYVATMVTFFVSGFWHGAGWTFVVWGILNGVLVCIAAYRNRKGKKIPVLLGISMTFILVILTRVLFVSETFQEAWLVYKGMLNIKPFLEGGVTQVLSNISNFVINHKKAGLTLVIGLCICWFAPTTKNLTEKFEPNKKYFIYATILWMACMLMMDKTVQFLYFQF